MQFDGKPARFNESPCELCGESSSIIFIIEPIAAFLVEKFVVWIGEEAVWMDSKAVCEPLENSFGQVVKVPRSCLAHLEVVPGVDYWNIRVYDIVAFDFASLIRSGVVDGGRKASVRWPTFAERWQPIRRKLGAINGFATTVLPAKLLEHIVRDRSAARPPEEVKKRLRAVRFATSDSGGEFSVFATRVGDG